MAMTMTEEMSLSLQRGLSEWWSEETEYVFQRIERWAAFARGYNRLRSQRLSRGRLTMQEEQEPRWSISSNKIVIEDPTWSPRFHNLKRSHRRKSRTDENCKINCCGTFNYQSNSNLDSTCLETYRYDHSIYFKTIGDIKSSKKDLGASKSEADSASCFGDEQLEWEAITDPGFVDRNLQNNDDQADELANENGNFCFHMPEFGLNIRDVDEEEDEVMDDVVHNVWPIVDLTQLSLNTSSDNGLDTAHYVPESETQDNFIVNETQSNENNNNSGNNNSDCNNCNEESSDSTQKMMQLQIAELANNQEGTPRILSFRKQRRSPRRVKQPTLVGDNNVMWPGVLLNYTKNIDPATSPHHHHHAVHVK